MSAYVFSLVILFSPTLARADVAPGPVQDNLWLVVSLAFTWGGIALYQWLVKRGRHKAVAIAIVLAVVAGGDVAAYYIYQATHARPRHHFGELGR
jgi:hypothetical protein